MKEVGTLEPKRQHERLRLSEFVSYLRAEGRSVSEPVWDDAPDAWVSLDGQRMAVELGGAYAAGARELWHQPDGASNLNFRRISNADDRGGRR